MQLIIKLAILLALVCCCHAGYKVTYFYGTGPTCSGIFINFSVYCLIMTASFNILILIVGDPADISYITSSTSCTGPTPCQGVYNAASSKDLCVSSLPTVFSSPFSLLLSSCPFVLFYSYLYHYSKHITTIRIQFTLSFLCSPLPPFSLAVLHSFPSLHYFLYILSSYLRYNI